jgi:hypothetical protein
MQIALRAAAAPVAAPAARRRAARTAAVLSLGVAWVHLAYTASHFRQWWAYGAFFLATGVGQALFAPLVLRRPQPWVALAGIAGNTAIVGMYILSRTTGPPLGPHARVPEEAGAIDLATTATEVVIVGVLLTLLGGRMRRWVADVLVAGAVLLWALRLSGSLP